MNALFEWFIAEQCYVNLTRTGVYVGLVPQHAGHPVGVKHSENQTSLKKIQYRL